VREPRHAHRDFDTDRGAQLAEDAGAPLLEQVPLDLAPREAADRGMPLVRDVPAATSTRGPSMRAPEHKVRPTHTDPMGVHREQLATRCGGDATGWCAGNQRPGAASGRKVGEGATITPGSSHVSGRSRPSSISASNRWPSGPGGRYPRCAGTDRRTQGPSTVWDAGQGPWGVVRPTRTVELRRK
jgi:hypothetical protein